MLKQQPLTNCFLFMLLACGIAFAQEQAPARRSSVSVPITVSATGTLVRFTAVGAVERMRLEVFDAAGAPVFDTGFKPGNLRDWRLRGTHGQFLPDATYLCVVTVRELSGRMTFKQGSVLLQGGQAALALEGGGEPERVEAEQALAARPAEEPPSMTVVAHDGRDGQVTSTSGDLTFRTGDTFSGKEKERMRLTEDGKLGIGTKEPQATLDVAGTVRASQGVAFADGTVLTSATGRAQKMNAKGEPEPLISGSGTTGRLTKWTNGPAEVVGDSIVTESSNKIGVGTANPKTRLDIKQNGDSLVGGLHLRRSATNDTWALATDPSNNLLFGYANNASVGDAVSDFTVVPLVLSANNRVGIGTNTPATKLHVVGSVTFTGLRTEETGSSPNVVGGFFGNNATVGVAGATIAGGGYGPSSPNRVTDHFGTVGGGMSNRAGDDAGTLQDSRFATVGGGVDNRATAFGSTVGGGSLNTARGIYSIVAGGVQNTAIGNQAFVGGGATNTALEYGTVAGGGVNAAIGIYSAVGGGHRNSVSGYYGTVPGGEDNKVAGDYGFAAGQRAEARHKGAFVWSDSTTAAPNVFASTAGDQFLIRAANGVGIGTNAPNHQLTIGVPEVPLITTARVGIYGAGSAYALVRDTSGNIEGLFGVDASGSIYGSMTNHAVRLRTNNTDRVVILANGDVFINRPDSLIVRSDDGACWRIKVTSTTGALTTGTVPCP